MTNNKINLEIVFGIANKNKLLKLPHSYFVENSMDEEIDLDEILNQLHFHRQTNANLNSKYPSIHDVREYFSNFLVKQETKNKIEFKSALLSELLVCTEVNFYANFCLSCR